MPCHLVLTLMLPKYVGFQMLVEYRCILVVLQNHIRVSPILTYFLSQFVQLGHLNR